MQRLEKWVNHTFGRRIAAFFIPVILMFILTVTGIGSRIAYASLLEISKRNIKGTVKQGNYTIDLYVQDIKTTAVLLADSEEVIYMLANYDKMNIREWFYQQELVDKILRNTSLMRDHILDCMIVGINGYQSNMPDRPELKNGIHILEEEWMQPCIRKKGGFCYTGAHPADYYYGSGKLCKMVISVVLPVVWYGERLGYIIVDLDFQKMNEIVNAGNETDELRYLVADNEGNIVFSDQAQEINTALSEEARQKLKQEDAFFFQLHGREMFCIHGKSRATQWEFLGLTAKENIMRPVVRMRNILIFVILPFFLIIVFFVSVRVAGRVKKPLEEIVAQLEQIDIDHPQLFVVKHSVGEVEYLAEKITLMSQKITNLVNQVYKAEIKSKDAQIEALISQIHPHFLYNTLQLIKTESLKGNPKEVSETVNCLSRFLRYTINNRQIDVPMYEELEHIRVYVEIYKKRFPGKYTLTICTDEGVNEILIPKLILQPVVENAIKHGISVKNEPGTISVTVKNENDLLVVIEDNGVGMERSAAGKLLEDIHGAVGTDTHIGLGNIQQRLELGCGKGYGIISIESEKGKNFKVWIKIKKGQSDV